MPRWGRRIRLVLVVALAVVGLPGCNGLPPGFRQDLIAGGLDLPTSFVFLSADDVLIAQKDGIVRIVRDNRLLDQPLIDLRSQVETFGDRGIGGMALDPDFAQNGYLYLSYAYEDWSVPFASQATQRISRFTVVGDTADPASEVVVLGGVTGEACYLQIDTPDCLPMIGSGHGIGDLTFDAEGMLLVAVGDGAVFWGPHEVHMRRAQDLDVLAGKILRFDPTTGEGAPSNPFYDADDPAANRSLVYAYGFRNPYRIAQNPATGTLYVGEVGGSHWEELDVIVPGGNYGWPCFEGRFRTDFADNAEYCDEFVDQSVAGGVAVIPPALSYPHTDRGGAIIGGDFYTGSSYPAKYQGNYFYGDYAMPFIREQRFDAADQLVGNSQEFADAAAAGAPVQLRMGPDGNLWYLSIYPGELRKIVYEGESPTPPSCPDNQYRVEYVNNADLEGTPASVRCEGVIAKELGLGSPLPGVNADHWSLRATGRLTFDGGTYRFAVRADDGVRLRVDGTLVIDRWTDSSERTDTVDLRLTTGVHTIVLEYYERTVDATVVLDATRLGTGPTVSFATPPDGLRVAGGSTVPFTVVASDAEDGPLSGAAVTVEATLLHHAPSNFHQHPHGSRTGTSGSFVLSDSHAAGTISFQLRARATDSSGWTTLSEPVDVCLAGSFVGPCA